MGTKVSFEAASGAGAAGELALPPGDGKAPAVLLFQEWWGVNDHIKSLVDRLAADGFVVLAPDLYEGKTTKDAGEAGKLMGSLDWGKAVDITKGAAKFLASHPRSNGKIGAIGFCMGGAMTFVTAANIPELAAAVPFYGIPDASKIDFTKIKAPVLAHVASHDNWVTPASAEGVKKTIDAAGGSMKVEIYDADHAFVNDTRPEVYSPDNAKLAWKRSVEFLHQHMG